MRNYDVTIRMGANTNDVLVYDKLNKKQHVFDRAEMRKQAFINKDFSTLDNLRKDLVQLTVDEGLAVEKQAHKDRRRSRRDINAQHKNTRLDAKRSARKGRKGKRSYREAA